MPEWEDRPDDLQTEPEDPAERELRLKAGMSRSMWRAMSGANPSIQDYRAAAERDRRRAERRGKR